MRVLRILLLFVLTIASRGGLDESASALDNLGPNRAAGGRFERAQSSINIQESITPQEQNQNGACEAESLPEVIATVGGAKILASDVDKGLSDRIHSLCGQVVEARGRQLEVQIDSVLLAAEAKKRGINVPRLIEVEVESRIVEPTEADAREFYDQNKDSTAAAFEKVRGNVVNYLRRQRRLEQTRKFTNRLRSASVIEVLARTLTPPTRAADQSRIVAKVNNEAITSASIEMALRPQITSVRDQIYDMRSKEVDRRINDLLLATEANRSKMSVKGLLNANVFSKTRTISKEEASAYYEQTKSSSSANSQRSVETVRIELQEQEQLKTEAEYLMRLRKTISVVVFLKRPASPFHQKMATDDRPSRGPRKASVVIVEFTDFQCPDCANAEPVLERLLREFAGKVRLIVRYFPLPFHANAVKAAEAAEAAREQGKYWEYVAILYKNQSSLDVMSLKAYASQLLLDRSKFDAALDSGKFYESVQRDVRVGIGLGVYSTPTLFVNVQRFPDANYEVLRAEVESVLRGSRRVQK